MKTSHYSSASYRTCSLASHWTSPPTPNYRRPSRHKSLPPSSLTTRRGISKSFRSARFTQNVKILQILQSNLWGSSSRNWCSHLRKLSQLGWQMFQLASWFWLQNTAHTVTLKRNRHIGERYYRPSMQFVVSQRDWVLVTMREVHWLSISCLSLAISS